jgi:hypothetical protein
MSNSVIDQLVPISDQVNRSVVKLIVIAHQIDPDNTTIPLLRRNVEIYIQASPLGLIKEIQPHIWKYKDSIKNRDESFFLSLSLSTFTKNTNETYNALFEILKNKISQLTKQEKTIIWDEFSKVLVAILKYTILKESAGI